MIVVGVVVAGVAVEEAAARSPETVNKVVGNKTMNPKEEEVVVAFEGGAGPAKLARGEAVVLGRSSPVWEKVLEGETRICLEEWSRLRWVSISSEALGDAPVCQ